MENETHEKNTLSKVTKPLYYCNIVNVEGSVFDITLNFGVKKDRTIQEAQLEDFDLTVAMSPQHAKAFVLALNQTIKDYEGQFGTINITPK